MLVKGLDVLISYLTSIRDKTTPRNNAILKDVATLCTRIPTMTNTPSLTRALNQVSELVGTVCCPMSIRRKDDNAISVYQGIELIAPTLRDHAGRK